MEQGTFHFVGVGGIGMSAIARILIARGEAVSGSDVKSTPLIEQLRAEGVRVTIGHDGANVAGAHTVVVSSAIDRRNPEYVAAQRAGTPLLHRGEMLARVMDGRQGVAICGTHGKTTTTAMTHVALRLCGIDASLVLGGIDGLLATNAHDGTSPWFVTEADESDGSFALLAPSIAVLTNIENDHLASDDELPQLVRAFDEFLRKLPADGVAIVGIDNPLSASLRTDGRRSKTVTYGIGESADLRATNLSFDGLGASFDVTAGDENLGTIELRVPGAINVQNALAAIVVARELGIPFARIAAALREFRGVRRRFDILARGERLVVVDDYAHHPTAVRATIAAARQYHPGPLVVAFQPHRYTRTAFLARDFADSLRGADRVYLAPIYAASEPAIPGVSERSIGEPLAASGTDVQYVARVEDLADRLFDEAPDGAMVLLLGAGNITDVAARLASKV
jgi:UDP-N-acetylmuramate--alanine ligase